MAKKYKKEYNEIMKEMLDLAGVPLYEAEDDIPNETDLEGGFDADEESRTDDRDEKGEINDQWDIKINSKGDFKIEFYETFVYVYYKNRRSTQIKYDPKLKPYKKLVSEFMNKVLSHVEKKS